MTRITLAEPTSTRLLLAAERRRTKVSELVAQAVDFYLASVGDETDDEAAVEEWEIEQKAIIEREMHSFLSQHQALLDLYQNQTIAMHNGLVIDHDLDEIALNRRIRSRFGNIPILITPVLPQPVQRLTVRSPRIVLEPAV